MPDVCSAAPAPQVHCGHLETVRYAESLYVYRCCFCGTREERQVPYRTHHGPYMPDSPAPRRKVVHADKEV